MLLQLNSRQIHAGPSVSAAAADAEGRQVALGNFKGEVQVWDLVRHALSREFRAHTAAVWSLAFSPDRLASSSFDETIAVWCRSSGRCLHLISDIGTCIWALQFSTESRLLASGSNNGMISIYSQEDAVCASTTHVAGSRVSAVALHDNAVRCVAFSSDETLLASGSDDCKAIIWSCETHDICCRIGHPTPVRTLSFGLPHRLATGSEDGLVKIWSITTAECIMVMAFGPTPKPLLLRRR